MKASIYLTTLCFLCGTLLLSGQSIERQVIGSTGNSYYSANGAIDYTVGETVIGTLANGGITLTQGFHQTANAGFGITDMTRDFMITVYPNPATTFLNVRFQNKALQENYLISIISFTGVTLLEKQIMAEIGLEKIVTFNVSILASATYVLRILNTSTGNCQIVLFDKTK